MAALPIDPGPYGPEPSPPWLTLDWSRHQRWVTIDGRAVNVVELGEGPPIVFLHGLSGSWTNWLEQLPVLAERHRVIALDLPGFGGSPLPREPITIPRYAHTVAAMMDELEVGPATVVGNSMGGFVAAELAIAEPLHVARLVLVSAAGLTIETWRNERALRALYALDARAQASAARVGRGSDRLVGRPRGRRVLLGVVAAHPERLAPALATELLRGSGKPGFVPTLDALTSNPIRGRLGAITCPTLIVWGRRDRLVPARDAAEFERRIPGSHSVVWRDTGHLPMLERPLAFNRLLAAFMAQTPAGVSTV